MEILWTPGRASGIVVLLGFAIGLLYLAVLPNKTRDTRLLLVVLGLVYLSGLHNLYYDITQLARLDTTVAYLEIPWGAFASQFFNALVPLVLLVLAYRIRFRLAIWEERVVVFGYAVVQGWLLWQIGKWVPEGVPDPGMRSVASNLGGFLFFWTFVVAARKAWRAHRGSYDVRTRRLCLLVMAAFFCLALAILGGTNQAGVWGLGAEWRTSISIFSGILFASLLFLAVLLYGEERHSVLAKLVGFLLVTYMALLVLSTAVLRPALEQRQVFSGPAERSTLLFTPDSAQGYTVARLPVQWHAPQGALQLTGDDDAAAMRAPFSFPFYGAAYDSLWIVTNGIISLGANIEADNAFTLGESFFEPVPSIAPLYADLIYAGTGAGSQIDATDSLLVVTWTRVSEFYLYESLLDFQALLYADGRIQFNYHRVTTPPLRAFVGISPGGLQEPTDLKAAPVSASAGGALFTFTDDRLAFRQFIAPLGRTWTGVGILGLFVFVAAGVVFFRVGLVRPLKQVLAGVQQVAAGNLDAEVRIGERNELGALADHFNSMTQSLRRYNQEMEALVEERTAALNQSLDHLKATQAQLVQQEKMASLGQLTAGIAHEIKNPLNFINNFAEVNEELADELQDALAKGETVDDIIADLKQNAAVIAQHGKRADGIVKSMMAHAREGKGEREAVNLNALIDEHVELAYHGKRAQVPEFSVTIERAYDEAVGTAEVIPQDFGRVILNLIGNAFDAVLEHAAQVNGHHEPVVRVSSRRKEGGVEVRVADNGPGMSDAVRAKVFEPFFTTKPTGSGTGLGLSLSYDIITQGHGGTMTVESDEGAGAAFIVTLPA